MSNAFDTAADGDSRHPVPGESNGLYCSGCNAVFAVEGDTRVCPRCGVVLDEDSFANSETMVFDSGDVRFDGGRSPVLLDERLDGRTIHVYECESLVGRGGMGQVYLARHLELHRRCALKILSPRVETGDLDFVNRFMTEGRAAASLVHPNVVTVHAIGEADGFHFLEMEFVAGRSLQDLVDREGALTPVRSMVLASQIADGLATAHRHGVVHRDLKLDNVLLSQHNTPKIADFGLAKRVLTGDPEGRVLCGTPHFMAPELFDGAPASPASDVYALGVCLFVMLTGEVPFRGNTFADLARTVRSERLPSLRRIRPEISLDIAECVQQLLSRAPAARPADGEAAKQLVQAVAGQVRDVESLLAESFAGDERIRWVRADRKYRVSVSLPDGRQQALFVEPSEHSASERLLLIYSVCCEARSDYFEKALELNATLSHGAMGIREIDGRPMFVMIDTYPRGTVDAEEVRRSVLEVAYRADAVEFELTGEDRY